MSRLRILLGLTLAALLCFYLFFPQKKDREDYLALLSFSEGKIIEKKVAPKQQREDVVKEVWSEGKYVKIMAPTSELFFVSTKEAIEELFCMTALVQERFIKENEPMQRIRTFSAAHARFYLRSFSLIGERVDFTSYIAPGYGLPQRLDQSLIEASGKAEEAVLRMKQEEFSFRAKKVTLTLDPEKKI